MRFGISVPNFGAFADVRRLVALARQAEEHGWDGFFLWDHIHWTQQPMLDPWVALAAIASATGRIRIGTMITPVARRRPWKLARETATLDHLSGGRLILGVGLGYPPDEEFGRLGEEPDEHVRARKLDEGLDVLTGLWSGEPFSFSGEHYRIDSARFLPRPVQQPRIPVWVAGILPARAPFRRAARWDGAVPLKVDSTGAFQLLTPDDVRTIAAYISGRRQAAGPFDIAVGAIVPADPARARDVVDAFADAGATWIIESDPEDIGWLEGRIPRGPPQE